MPKQDINNNNVFWHSLCYREKIHVQFDFFVSLILSYLFYNIRDIINVNGIKKSEYMITIISNSHTTLSANSYQYSIYTYICIVCIWYTLCFYEKSKSKLDGKLEWQVPINNDKAKQNTKMKSLLNCSLENASSRPHISCIFICILNNC